MQVRIWGTLQENQAMIDLIKKEFKHWNKNKYFKNRELK